MNQNSYNTTSTPSADRAPADSISRRAYELWEQEGRPEGNDLRHWLLAEQELGAQSPSTAANDAANDAFGYDGQSGAPATDIRPLQGTRAGAATGRDGRRSSRSPFAADRAASPEATVARSEPAAGRRR